MTGKEDFKGLPEDLKDIQLADIDGSDILDTDILLGRGGRSNHHPGNARYLEIAKAREMEYFYIESRTEKTEMSMNMVLELRKEGIRFLEKVKGTKDTWFDVGNKKMRDKMAQRLREEMPKIKKRLAAEEATKLQQQQQAIPQQPASSIMMGQPQPFQPSHHQQFLQQQLQQQQAVLNSQVLQAHQQEAYRVAQQMSSSSMQNSQMYPQQVFSGATTGGVGSLGGYNSYSGDPIPFNAGGVPIQAAENINDNMNPVEDDPYAPLPAGPSNEPELRLPGQAMSRLSGLSDMSDLGEGLMESLIDEYDKGTDDDDDSFQKRRSFSNRDHENMRSSFSLPTAERKPRSSIASGSGEALRDLPYALDDPEVVDIMGASNTSLLEYLKVDAVPEEDSEDEPDSPKPTQYAGKEDLAEFTPNASNRASISKASLLALSEGGPATVTPTEGVGAARTHPMYSALDDKVMETWANGSGDLSNSPFAQVNSPPFPVQQPALRRQTSPGGSPNKKRGSPRKVKSGPGRAQSPTQNISSITTPRSVSPKPPGLTMSKRQTSHQNETPETRHHLHYQDGPWYDLEDEEEEPKSVSRNDPSMSSWASVKKPSMGRDRSAVARTLKERQKYQSVSLPEGSAVWAEVPTQQAPMTPPMGGKPSALASLQMGGGGGVNNTTPKTARMMSDFGKLGLLANKNKNMVSPRTANSFQERVSKGDSLDGDSVHQIPMELMVQKPSSMQWRNRTSTIEALDLDSLDDDPVLKRTSGLQGGNNNNRTSINSIANSWANMPSSEEFEAIISDLANKTVGDLTDTGGGGGSGASRATNNNTNTNGDSKPLSLSLPLMAE